MGLAWNYLLVYKQFKNIKTETAVLRIPHGLFLTYDVRK
jgi:hypothetical protein